MENITIKESIKIIKPKKKDYERCAVAYRLDTKKITRIRHLEDVIEKCYNAMVNNLDRKGYFKQYCFDSRDIRIEIIDNTLKCYYDYPALEETKAEN